MAEPTVQQLVDMYANVPRTEVEMEGAVVRGQIPKPVYRDGVNLDVSMVGDKFVHIGKLSELAAIDEAFAPKNGYLARQVSPAIYEGNIKYDYEKTKDMKKEEDYNELRTNILTPVGGGAFLVAGVSAGKDSEGNDIPIIVYKDEEIGVRGLRSGPTTYAYPSDKHKDYFSVNTEGFGQFSHNYVIPRSKIIDYPFDPSVNVGLEASRNYGQDFSERIAPEPIPPPPVLVPIPPPVAMPVELDEPFIDYNRPYKSPFRTMYRKGN